MLDIKINTIEVERILNAKLHQLQHPNQLMAGIAAELLSITEGSFMNQASPDGTPWQELSMITTLGRAKNNTKAAEAMHEGKRAFNYDKRFKKEHANASHRGGILNNEGRLMRIMTSHTATTATIGVPPHPSGGAIHQFGGMAGRGRSVAIPARPFLPMKSNGDIMDEAQRSVLEMCMEYFEKN